MEQSKNEDIMLFTHPRYQEVNSREKHAIIKKMAPEIIKFFFANGQNKYKTAKHFGISYGGIESALLIMGHEDKVSRTFRKRFGSEAQSIYVEERKAVISTPEITFEKMMNFMLELLSKAEQVSTVNHQNTMLQEECAKMKHTISQLQSVIQQKSDLETRLRVAASQAYVVHSND